MSESDTTDSDQGIRYKTESTRHKEQSCPKYSHHEKDFVRSSKKFTSHKHSKKKFKRSETDSSSDDEYHKRNYDNRRKKNYERFKSSDIVNRGDNSCRSLESSNLKIVSFGPALPPHLKQKLDNTDSELHTVPIGPVLPPHLQQPLTEPSVETENSKNEKDKIEDHINIIDPDLPFKNKDKSITGSALLPHLQRNVSKNNSVENKKEMNSLGSVSGPALPSPSLIEKNLDCREANANNDLSIESSEKDKAQSSGSVIIGPALPSNMRQKLLDNSSAYDFNKEEDEVEEEGGDVYGPIPEGTNLTKAHLELEERALQMRIDQLDPSKDKEPTREEWMIELPAAKRAAFGLGPRNFKMKAGPDLSDRSSWTDTPQDKAKKKIEPKVDLKEEARLKQLHKRDKEQEEKIKRNKKRKESLLELHTKKIKTNKKDNDSPNERRPFSRDVDLQVNRFDEAQKKAILKKAQLLDDRFSSGEAKFL